MKKFIIYIFSLFMALSVKSQTLIQTASGNTGTLASTTFNVTLGSSPVNGNTLIAVISTRSNSTNNVDTILQAGTIWTRAISSIGYSTNNTTTEIWYTTAVSGAANSITITQGSARSAAVIMEYSGLVYGAPLDKTASNRNTSTSTTINTGTTTATASNDQLWIGGIGLRSSTYTLSSIINSFTSIASTNSTNTTASNNAKIYALKRKVSTTGTAVTGGTVSSKSYWSGAVATFKVAVISSFAPISACKSSSDVITINGSGFTSGSVVDFNGTAATTTYVSPTQITATLPAAATPGFIHVTTSGSVVESKKPFLIKAPVAPTANITKTTCPASSDGAVSPDNIPVAINFDNTKSQYVNLGATLLNNLSAFTLEGWVKCTSYNRNSFFGQNNAVEIGFASNGIIELWSEGLRTNIYSPTAFPTDGFWHHIAGTGDGTNMKIYMDGELVASKAHAALPATIKYGSSAYNAAIGGYVWDAATPNYHNGQMLKVGFWNTALTNTQIAALASTPHEYYTGETNLIAGYNFFEGTGTTLFKTPSGTNGTLTGTPVSTWTDLFTYSWIRVSGGFGETTKNISALPTGTYNLAASFNGCTANSGDFVVASNGSESTASDSIAGVIRTCPNTEIQLILKGGALGTGASWKWYADACGTNEIVTGLNNGRDTLTITPVVTTTYYARAEGTCNTTACVSKTVTINATGEWLGTTSTDWNTDANWCGGVPTLTTDVLIPTSPAGNRFPIVGTAGAVCKSLTIATGASVTMDGAYSFNVYGNFVNNGTFTPSTSTVTFMENGSVSGTSTTTFHNLTIYTGKTLTGSNATINVTGDWTNNGTFTNNSGTVVFNGTTAAQSLGGSSASTFYNLTINNTYTGGGVRAGNNITVENILNLSAANPSGTSGALEMASSYTGYPATDLTYWTQITNPIVSDTLKMGPNATTVGQGDVTGIIYRDSIVANTSYTFGHEFTTYNYTVAPTEVALTVTIGTAYGQSNVWGYVSAVKRSYEMVPTGGDGGKVAMTLHYLDTELNGNTELSLVTGDFDIGPDGAPLGDEHGRSSYDFTNNYIGLTGVPMYYFQYNDPSHKWRTVFIMHNYYTGHTTWDGSTSNSWMNDANWSNGVPGVAMTAIIPDSAITPNDPILAANDTIGGIQILSGGILNLHGETITIAGYNSSGWEDQSGLSNYTGSTVILQTSTVEGALLTTIPISGVPHFDNLTINSNAVVSVNENSHIYISGTFTNSGTFNASGVANIIEYNGSSAQAILNPMNSAYYNLTMSGSGTKTLPTASMSILGDLNLSSTITATSNTIVFNGSATQTLSGTSSSALNNVTLNNINGLTLSKNQTVDGVLTFTNGLITTGSNAITLTCNASTTGESSVSYVNGKLARDYCGIESKLFPIGKGGNYRQLTIARTTGASGSSTIQSEQFEATITGTLPANITAFADRFWTISQTSGAETYTIQLDGTGFTPAGTAVIVKGDGTAPTELTKLSATTPDYKTAVGLSTFGDFTLGSECLPPTITTQPQATSSCELSGTPQFSVGVTGTYTYQWEEKTTESGATFGAITDGGVYSNATTSTLTITNPPFSMNGYAYRAIVTRTDCGGSTTSNGLAILTVNPQPQGSLTANSICKGEEGFLTWTKTLGTGLYDITFNNGVKDSTVYNIESGVAFSVGNHTSSKTYTLVSVIDDKCTRTTGFTQGSATVNVNPYITWEGTTSTDWNTATNWCGGIPTSTDNVLIPAAPTNQPIISTIDNGLTNSIIIENGASVTVSSTDSLKVSGNITNAGTISMGLGTLVIAGGTIIENDGIIETQNTSAQPLPQSSNYGNAGTIRFNSTAAPQTLFAGTYNDVVIDNTHGVTLAAGASVVANGKLEIKSGSKLEIGTGRLINANTVVNNAGAAGIRIKSENGQPSGSLIFNNTETTPIQATVEMYSKANWDKNQVVNAKYKWQFIGIPVQSLDVLPTFYGGYVRRYSEAGIGSGYLDTNRWKQLQNGSIMEALTAYEIVQPAAKKYEFPGMLYNQSIQKTLSYTVGADYPGQHLIGNPYTTAIDIKAIEFDVNTNATVYLYNTGTFSNWQDSIGRLSFDSTSYIPGQYIAITKEGAGSNGLPRQIPSMQAFLVRTLGTTDGSITVNYNAVKQKNFSVQRSKKEALSSLRLQLIGEKMDYDATWLFIQEGTTRSFDNGWDAYKLAGDAGTARIQSLEANDEIYQINAVPDANETVITARAGANDTSYKLKINNENMMSKYNSLYLLDLNTNNLIDISQNVTEYSFTMTNTSSEPRFKILTSAGLTTGNENADSEIYVTLIGKKLIISNTTNKSGVVSIFDVKGIEVLNSSYAENKKSVVDLNIAEGVYLYKLTNSDGKTRSRKIVIK